jgi:CRP/FNR family transcriptional regulator, cyclic AMP receptor protein
MARHVDATCQRGQGLGFGHDAGGSSPLDDRLFGGILASVHPLLELTSHLPEAVVEPGEVVIAEGARTGIIWVLVSGALDVTLNGEPISRIDRPGSTIGEVAVLLEQPHGATVTAVTRSVLRRADDGDALLELHPPVARLVAADLARRLDNLTVYLADLQVQYQGATGLAMVPDVLRHLSGHRSNDLRPVAARDPEPEY